MSLNDQHELTVLGRKHQNLKIFGFWWFMNQPSIIEPVLKMRMDLLGLSFIPQHSDASLQFMKIAAAGNLSRGMKSEYAARSAPISCLSLT